MSQGHQETLKFIAATATVIGLLLGFLERRYAPTTIVTEDSPSYPVWLAWLGWIVAAAGSIGYIIVDFFSK